MLAHGGLDLLRYFYNGILSFSSADTALWFARDLLAGAVVVLLFSVVRPQNSAKIVLGRVHTKSSYFGKMAIDGNQS
jgi:hypothetical protein